MRDHLVIGDAHAKPGTNNKRFHLLGKLIVKRLPEVIVNIGDWADMPSMCSHDKGTKGFEGRRYAKDIKAANNALDIVESYIAEYNKGKAPSKQYKPLKVALMGNHEHRINRRLSEEPVLEGVISTDDIKFKEAGWKVYPFMETCIIDGVAYKHYFESGVMGRPIGGEYPAASLIKKQFHSCTAGHSHILDYAIRTNATGDRMMGMHCGCFFEHKEEYATGYVNNLWWRGLVYKHSVSKGDYAPEFITMRMLKRICQT